MDKILKIYDEAKENMKDNLYDELKTGFERELNGNISKLKAYQMRSSSQKFSEIYTSSMALFISILGLINDLSGEHSKVTTLAFILAFLIVVVLVAVITYHKRDRKYMESLFVLNEIEKEMNEKKKEKQKEN